MRYFSILLYGIFFLISGVGIVTADMPGTTSMHDKDKSQMMSTQHATQGMMHQSMSKQSKQNMMQMIEDMRNNMMQMSQIMEQHNMMNEMHLSEAAKLMEHMSQSMHQMSMEMHSGKFDEKTMAAMKERNKEMHQMMEALQKKIKTEQN